MEEGRDATGRIFHQPLLQSCHHISQKIRISLLLKSILGEMPNTVGYLLTTFCSIQLPLLVEEIFHIHTSQLGNALFLRHLAIELVNLLL